MIEGVLPFRGAGIRYLRSLFKTHTGMNMTGPGDGLFQRLLKILQEALRHTDPVGKVRRDNQFRPRIKIVLHHTGMETYPTPVRLMRHHDAIPLTELRGNVDERQVLLQRKIIPARMAIDKYRSALHAEFQVMIKGGLEIFKIPAMRLVLMGHQQKLFFLQCFEKLPLYGWIVRYPGIDAVISGFPDPVAKGGYIDVLVPPQRRQYFYFHK